MGFGDEIMSTGFARGARARGKRVAVGDGKRIIWGQWCEQIFRNNQTMAPPGSEGADDLEWVRHYKGSRLYVKTYAHGRWAFRRGSFQVSPGEIIFDAKENEFREALTPGFVLIEPRVKDVYPNKQWPQDRYKAVAKWLLDGGVKVCQLAYGAPFGPIAPGVQVIRTDNFRWALAVLSRAALYIGPEGGLGHGAAAFGLRAVIIFGGFSDPEVVGYPWHVKLTGGVQPCGSLRKCAHCQMAMSRITKEEVYRAAIEQLSAQPRRIAVEKLQETHGPESWPHTQASVSSLGPRMLTDFY